MGTRSISLQISLNKMNNSCCTHVIIAFNYGQFQSKFMAGRWGMVTTYQGLILLSTNNSKQDV